MPLQLFREYRKLERERTRGKLVGGFSFVLMLFLEGAYYWQWGAYRSPLGPGVPPDDARAHLFNFIGPPLVYFLLFVFSHWLYTNIPGLKYSRDMASVAGLGEVMPYPNLPANINAESVEFIEKMTDEEAKERFDEYRHRKWQSLWIPTLFHLTGVALLVHYTGGPIDSPIAVLPASMITAGMLISNVPPLEVPVKWRSALRLGWEAVHHFQYALSILVATYVILLAAEHNLVLFGHDFNPFGFTLKIDAPPAPESERLVVFLLATLFTTVMTYLARGGLKPVKEPEPSLAPRGLQADTVAAGSAVSVGSEESPDQA